MKRQSVAVLLAVPTQQLCLREGSIAQYFKLGIRSTSQLHRVHSSAQRHSAEHCKRATLPALVADLIRSKFAAMTCGDIMHDCDQQHHLLASFLLSLCESFTTAGFEQVAQACSALPTPQGLLVPLHADAAFMLPLQTCTTHGESVALLQLPLN